MALDIPVREYDGSTKSGDPAYEATAVTPSDANDLPYVSTAIWVGGAGALAVVMVRDWFSGMTAAQAQAVSVSFGGIAAGSWMPLRVARVMSTGTVATLITIVRR